MKHLLRLRSLFVTLGCLMLVPSGGAADAPDVDALLGKAIRALGGETNLAKARALFWRTKGQVRFDGTDNPFTGKNSFKDWRHARLEFEGEFGGNQVRGVTLLDGDKGSRDIGGNETELDRETLANERRQLQFQLVPALLLPLKDKALGYKIESATRAKLGERSVVDLKIVPKEGKDFTLSLDEESGRPVRVSGKVLDWSGNEVHQEIHFSAYKEFSGIQKATQLLFKRDGERLMDVEIVEFKLVD